MLADGWYEALTPLQRALVDAAVRIGGGGAEDVLEREASRFGENGAYGAKAHFAKGLRALEARGIFRKDRVRYRDSWLTEDAARDLGLDYVPANPQEGLF
jgi:hypothetical protein